MGLCTEDVVSKPSPYKHEKRLKELERKKKKELKKERKVLREKDGTVVEVRDEE
jgi:predicted GIY-YIG superfamily endonuclease